jgi:Rod binding domain-containing protein
MTGSVPSCGAAPVPAPLRAVAQSFEAVFTRMLMQSMRSTVKKVDLFHGGRAEEMFTGLLDQALTQVASLRGRGLGIAGMIEEQYAANARNAKNAYGG